MESIDLKNYLTVNEAAEAMGASLSGFWRAIRRIGRDKVCIEFLSRTLVRKDRLHLLKENFYPYYSDAHQAKVKEWGAKGGHAKAANAQQGGRRRASANGKSGEQA